MSIFTKKPISLENRTIFRNNVCKSDETGIHVCCAFEESEEKPTVNYVLTQEPQWLTELRQKVPKAPYCGQDSQDRIIGGSKVAIGNHPWVVLLEYLNGAQDLQKHE